MDVFHLRKKRASKIDKENDENIKNVQKEYLRSYRTDTCMLRMEGLYGRLF